MNYPEFTNNEIATVVSFAIASYPEAARRRFKEEFGKDAPPRTTIVGWMKRFKETFSLTPSAPVGDHSARRLSQEKREEIVRTIQEDPTISQRKLSAACEISLSTVNKVLREEGIRPWKFTKVQEIWPDDNARRLEFANLIINRHEQDSNFIGNIVFSDEASFHLNGSVNMHNAFIYAEENPHAICVKP